MDLRVIAWIKLYLLIDILAIHFKALTTLALTHTSTYLKSFYKTLYDTALAKIKPNTSINANWHITCAYVGMNTYTQTPPNAHTQPYTHNPKTAI